MKSIRLLVSFERSRIVLSTIFPVTVVPKRWLTDHSTLEKVLTFLLKLHFYITPLIQSHTTMKSRITGQYFILFTNYRVQQMYVIILSQLTDSLAYIKYNSVSYIIRPSKSTTKPKRFTFQKNKARPTLRTSDLQNERRIEGEKK